MVHQSTTHDCLVALLSAHPRLICELWERETGNSLPPGVARIRDTNLRARSIGEKPRYLQVDVLITIHATYDPDDPALFALVVEVQLGPDDEKLYTWVEYLAAARRQYQCEADVLVFSHRPRVLRWAERLFANARRLCPTLFGRDQISVIDDDATALRRPAHAILAAVFHADSDRVAELARLAVLALTELPAWQRSTTITLLEETLREDIVDSTLQQLASEALEEAEREARHTWPWRIGHREGLAEGIEQGIERGIEQGIEQGIERGRLDALREAVWLIVELRGLAVVEADRVRVGACSDPDRLHRWLIRLKTAERFADALAD